MQVAETVQEGQGEVDDANPTPLRDGSVPTLGQDADFRQCHKGEPRQGDGQGHKEPAEAIRGADLDCGQAEATLGVFE